MASFSMARKLIANFSNRVPIRLHSFSQPTQHSMMLRRLRNLWGQQTDGKPMGSERI